ncbi:MAG TPA: S24 family peptidase, partial [Sphingomonas sp.]
GFARTLQVTPDEVLERVGVPLERTQTVALPPFNARVQAFEGDGLESPSDDLPVWGTGIGTERLFDGEAVEQTDLNSGAVLEYVRRPAILKGKKEAYSLHVTGSSMHPALPDGDQVVACRNMPLSAGDNVVVYLRDDSTDDGQTTRGVLVKELVRRSASWVELRQYSPALDFRVPMSDVLRIDRILTKREMLS